MHHDHDRLVIESGSAGAHAASQVDELALQRLTGLSVRSVRASDKGALSALFDRLSPRSRHYRFLGPKRKLSPRELENLVDLDHVEREALALGAPDGRFIAVARYGPVSDDPSAAEVALTVADEWQDRGIGSALASLLIAEARRSRIVRLHAMTLAENYPSRSCCAVWASRSAGSMETSSASRCSSSNRRQHETHAVMLHGSSLGAGAMLAVWSVLAEGVSVPPRMPMAACALPCSGPRDLVPREVPYAARTAPTPALARGAIHRPFVSM
jgi:GNAT superfamily N-acetyltransferase